MQNDNHNTVPDVSHDDHATPIKTPKQLITVILLALLVPTLGIVMLVIYITSGSFPAADSKLMSAEAVSERLKPIGQVAVVDANAPKVEKSGKEVTELACVSCHAVGALGAPKIGDKGSWAPRLGQGLNTLAVHAINGIRSMPARGGNPDLSDLEVARAVVYMANQSGASFKEPQSFSVAKK